MAFEKGGKILARLYLKSCPRCGGDMTVDRDYYGIYKMCLQCGHVVDIDPATIKKLATTKAA